MIFFSGLVGPGKMASGLRAFGLGPGPNTSLVDDSMHRESETGVLPPCWKAPPCIPLIPCLPPILVRPPRGSAIAGCCCCCSAAVGGKGKKSLLGAVVGSGGGDRLQPRPPQAHLSSDWRATPVGRRLPTLWRATATAASRRGPILSPSSSFTSGFGLDSTHVEAPLHHWKELRLNYRRGY